MFRRKAPTAPSRHGPKVPLLGGTLKVTIEPEPPELLTLRHKSRIIEELQQKAKLGTGRPSDVVEHLKIVVQWAPERNALGAPADKADIILPESVLQVVSITFY